MKIFITGGTTGIGWSVALEYMKSGHEVAVCGRSLDKLPTGWKEDYPKLSAYEVDVLNRDVLHNAVKDFAKGELDMMFASAGRSVGNKTKLPNFEAARDVISINVIGLLNTFEVAMELMIPKQKGHLVALASVAGMVGLPGASSYSASKAAVLKLCESYSLDLKNEGIDVTAIAPGFIDTPLTRKNSHKMPWLMTSEKAAKKIKKALDAKEVLFVFPWQMKMTMYVLDRMPRWLYRFMMGFSFLNYSK
jgi:short-subunit dehydrogenase